MISLYRCWTKMFGMMRLMHRCVSWCHDFKRTWHPPRHSSTALGHFSHEYSSRDVTSASTNGKRVLDAVAITMQFFEEEKIASEKEEEEGEALERNFDSRCRHRHRHARKPRGNCLLDITYGRNGVLLRSSSSDVTSRGKGGGEREKITQSNTT